ncbi:MAG: short-chain dehydrogenase [Acidimicrobiaceae bacterium]|nr:short-chain dehydrogenase [Acidimicrobiaceae bacterium]|tara:strand:- start:3278 stop:4045 length:768 start_codon:yes stop_codon:yes gene_type:complete
MNDPLNVFRLDGKIALVTGASSGIGAQTVKLFSSLGAKVIAAARREDRLQDLANQYPNVMAVKCDVGVEADCKNVVDTVINEYGKIDILINNAGISDPIPALEEDLDLFKRVIQIDLISCFHLAQLCAQHMETQETGGAIVNVASIHGFVGSSPNNQPGYTAAKGGLINLTRELALEWARHGIRVNAIAPGYISTELTDEMIAGESGRKWIERNTPMRRPGEVNELDGAMLLLASDAGSYITGETIAIDGGWLAR